MKDLTKMKVKIVLGIIFLVLMLLALKVDDSKGSDAPTDAQHLVVHMADSDKTDGVKRVMDVDNPDATFSGMTRLLDDETGYMKLWGHIGDNEATYLYSDALILVQRHHVKRVIITVSSGGGSAFAGLGIADTIATMREAGILVEGHAFGYVASAAVPVLAACEKRIATKNCMFMVHEGKLQKYLAQETAEDLASQQKMMNLIEERYLETLAKNSKLPAKTWAEMEKATTWFTADQALEYGLVDEIH